MMRKVLLPMMLVAALGTAQARGTVPLIEPARVVLFTTDGKSPGLEFVKRAIVKGGARREWAVRDDQPGKLTLAYNKGSKHEVVVDISYDTDGYQIRYVSSRNMKYEANGSQPEIHPFYNKWVANLSQDIVTESQTGR